MHSGSKFYLHSITQLFIPPTKNNCAATATNKATSAEGYACLAAIQPHVRAVEIELACGAGGWKALEYAVKCIRVLFAEQVHEQVNGRWIGAQVVRGSERLRPIM